MNLSPEQKQQVAQWVDAGESIAEIQKRLGEEFGLSITYMDARFLIDDLGLEIKSRPKISASTDLSGPSETEAPRQAQPAAPSPEDEAGATLEETELDEAESDASSGTTGVAVAVDTITRPGTVVSGTVTFSDKMTAKWALDQFGRLMLEPATPGYQPNPQDVQAFQQELSRELQRKGF